MVTISRGDVVLCDLNPVVGAEQAGVRPAVVLQIDRANAASPHTIIAPFTTKIRRALLPSHVFVPAGTGGLSQDGGGQRRKGVKRPAESGDTPSRRLWTA